MADPAADNATPATGDVPQRTTETFAFQAVSCYLSAGAPSALQLPKASPVQPALRMSDIVPPIPWPCMFRSAPAIIPRHPAQKPLPST